ncbi:MAG: ABC transporter ATP-binding protein [Pseudomonadota bacterium]
MSDHAAAVTIRNLSIGFGQGQGPQKAVDGLTLEIARGEIVGVVGESGSGKSLTAASILGMLPKQAHVTGSVKVGDTEVLGAPAHALQAIRGGRAAMVFQNPMACFSPYYRIGQQIVDIIVSGGGADPAQTKDIVLERFAQVRLPDPERSFTKFPHEFSGGQLQRAAIALALARGPEILLADEPTTALDVTTQAEIIDLLSDLRNELGLSILFITHDLLLLDGFADRIAVMFRGHLVETGPTQALFDNPQETYTRELLGAVPGFARDRTDGARAKPQKTPLLELDGVSKFYRTRHGRFAALDQINLTLQPGECLGVIGESGSGKSTLATLLLQLSQPDPGEIRFDGQAFDGLDHRARQSIRKRIGAVFQNPYSSLNPRMTVGQIIAEPLRLIGGQSKTEAAGRVRDLLTLVGLDPSVASRYPRAFSGGQRQRIAIARAVACEPDLLIMDEPTSALDVTVQAQIIEVLKELHQRLRMAMIFISHDLAVVSALCSSVAVLKQGKLVEYGPIADVLFNPSTTYTKNLIAAAPSLDKRAPSAGD